MGKVLDYLQNQLKSEDAKLKKDAEDCIKIYEKLKEINDGSVWGLQWQQLVNPKYKGFPSDDRTYYPTNIGYVFLKGIEKDKPKEERKAGVRYISVQMAIVSHLSDAQEMNSVGMGDHGYDHINFAKQLVLTYPDTSIEVSENELNELWKRTIN